MEKIYIDPNWNFKETVEHLEALKSRYEEILASFSYYEMKFKNKFLYETKQKVYSLNFEEWKIDKIWNYLNGFEFLFVIKSIANRQK